MKAALANELINGEGFVYKKDVYFVLDNSNDHKIQVRHIGFIANSEVHFNQKTTDTVIIGNTVVELMEVT